MIDKSQLGQVHVFWGDGKGKTTSALGTALRACGSGFRVHFIQFMKNKTGDAELDLPGEIRALKKFDNFSYERFGAGSWIIGEPKQHHIDEVENAFAHLDSSLNGNHDIIIADEILYSIQLGLLEEEKLINLIKSKPTNKELILTGSHKALPNLFELADLVTEVKKIKHPYDKGILARKGIEY